MAANSAGVENGAGAGADAAAAPPPALGAALAEATFETAAVGEDTGKDIR